jgi:hypothetical protein
MKDKIYLQEAQFVLHNTDERQNPSSGGSICPSKHLRNGKAPNAGAFPSYLNYL